MASPATARRGATRDALDSEPRSEWAKDAIDILVGGALLMIALLAIL